MRRSPAQVSVTVAIAIAIVSIVIASPASEARATAAPDWKLRTTEGTEVSLHEALARGPGLVSFWALWCNPCLKELPHLDALARETRGRLTILAINADGPKSVARVRPYLQSHRIGLTVPLDTSGDVARALQVGGILPFLVLYDAKGNEVYRHVGYREGDESALRTRALQLLGGTPGGSPAGAAADTAAAQGSARDTTGAR